VLPKEKTPSDKIQGAIWKRELQAYFLTPTGYVFMGVFLLLSSVMFYLQIKQTTFPGDKGRCPFEPQQGRCPCTLQGSSSLDPFTQFNW